MEVCAQAVAERVCAKIISATQTAFTVKGHTFRLSQSIGFVTTPQDGADVEDLVRKAD